MNRHVILTSRWLLFAVLVAACLLLARGNEVQTVPDGLHYMPPHPTLIEKLSAQSFPLLELSKLDRGIDIPEFIPNPPSGEFNLLVILVQFSDNPGQYGIFNEFDDLFFNTFNYDSVADYFSEISYDSLSITTSDLPSSTSWITATLPYNTHIGYVNADLKTGTKDDFGWGDYPQNLQGIVADIIPLIDDAINFSEYDNDGDGFVDGVVFVHAGPGAEFSGDPKDIWSATWDMSSGSGPGPVPTGDGVYVDNFAFGPEYFDNLGDLTIGVYAHELGHLLFGLPDLYDLDDTSYGVGDWSLMSYGAWLGPNGSHDGSKPAWPDAWSRIKMGFESPQVITGNITGFEFLPVLSSPGNVVKLWTPYLGDREYFLVEYRQNSESDYDKYLPGSGLLIWHVDETKWNRWELNQAECNSSPCCACETDHPLLALAQADGKFHLENKNNEGDSGDPFPTSNNHSFKFGTDPTYPESGSYYADACPANSCIAVNNIITGTGSINADLNVVCQAQGACVNVLAERKLGWGEPGVDVAYEALIQNCGDVSDIFTLSYMSGWDTEIFDLQAGEPITQVVVLPGQGKTVGISVTPPVTALGGSTNVLSLTVSSEIDPSISTMARLTTAVPYCTLLVDDDRGAPDVERAYTDALLGAGFDFDLWDTQVRGSPDEATLAAHKAVVWFTGTPISDTLTPHDESALSSYLQDGGGFFLSSQEYLTDTLRNYFGRQYLRVSTFVDNAGTQVVAGVPGNPLSDGLGPYTMSLTTTLSDRITPLSMTLSAFMDEVGITNAITYDSGIWRTLFLGWPFEHLARKDGEELMASTLDWLGVPSLEIAPIIGDIYMYQPISFTITPLDLNEMSYVWDFGDGTVISRKANPTHKFSKSGWHTITLAVSDRCTVFTQMQVYVRPLIYLPLALNKLDSNATGADIWQGSAWFALATISAISLGVVVRHPFRRR